MCDLVLLEPVTGTQRTVSQITKINFVLSSPSLDPLFLMSPWRDHQCLPELKETASSVPWDFPRTPTQGISLLQQRESKRGSGGPNQLQTTLWILKKVAVSVWIT